MAHQVHNCATTHVMTVRIGRASPKRLIPVGGDGFLRALAGLSGGANRGRDPYREPKHPRQHTLGTDYGIPLILLHSVFQRLPTIDVEY
jgi:hypothetical protein